MPHGHKKTPFSGKAKRAQLQAKKEKKSGHFQASGYKPRTTSLIQDDEDSSGQEERSKILKINQQPVTRSSRSNPNRYALQFHKETEAELQASKELARKTIVPVPESELEVAIEDYFLPELDFPKRPPWSIDMTRAQLESREHRYFTEYISKLEEKFSWKELSYFELNLETWRQLWRVLEMSDIILVIVDIRYSALMFPPSLYRHVTEILHKAIILVLNKVDLAPPPLVVAWKHYFKENYPELHILTFTSYPSYNLRGNQSLQVRRRRGKMRMAAEGAQKLYEACKTIVQNEVDLTSWYRKISEEMELEYENDDLEVEEVMELKQVDTSFYEHEKYREGMLTIGCVGQPNVGKSSLMNAIMGKKVVSVSKTPGHTKHFQTIHLTSTVRLCDCPGLVFPSKVPKTIQVLMGSFPIAQLRDPYSAIRYLAERCDLPKLLKLKHPENDEEWSAIDVCDGWALKRGFYTARAARLDTYRAANQLLRMALDGKICICLRPPGYSMKKDEEEDEILPTAAGDMVGQESESSEGQDSDDEEEEESKVKIGVHNKFAALLPDD
uniref:Guanine nucleotide-binding protein-like 1 n=1 Tax=Timema monikensis TaxID=170555 RepID=A0A7R9E5M4_9NEOP|nr:unnamed protein product [Timema monikensis]